MKKLSLVAMALILSVGLASAQVGLQAGYSTAKSSADNSKAMNGFHVGPVYNMTIQGPISLQYGLLYNMYMQTQDLTAGSGNLRTGLETKYTNHQIDIPVRVAVAFPLNSSLSVFAFGGPNFNLGLASNGSTQTWALGKEVGDPVKSNAYDNKDLSRFNLQLGVGAGLQFNNMGVKFSYDFGMLDMDKSDAINYKVNGLKVGLFYNF